MTSSRSPSTVKVAATAAEAVRELTHRTLGPPALTGPAELDRLVAELAVMTDTLPQLLRQLSGWLAPNSTPAVSGPTTTPTPPGSSTGPPPTSPTPDTPRAN